MVDFVSPFHKTFFFFLKKKCFNNHFYYFFSYNYFSIHIVNVLCNSYTMAARDFADIYTQSPRAAGPRAAGVYVSKISSSMVQVIYITWGVLT